MPPPGSSPTTGFSPTGSSPTRASRAPGVVWVVAGPPGAGKSTVAAELARVLDPPPAVLDKDVLFGGLVSQLLAAYGRGHGEREGEWYDAHVKVHEYGALTDAARAIRANGTPVLLDAPFTGQIHDPAAWDRWVVALGGEPVRLVWVRTDARTLRKRLLRRGDPKDRGKLTDWEVFVARMRPGQPPPVPHQTVDNRHGASSVEVQVAGLLSLQ